MARVYDRNACEAVKVFATVLIRDRRSFRVINNDGNHRLHEAGHYIVFVLLDRIHKNPSLLAVRSWLLASELARVFARPAFDDHFLFGVELNSIATLSMHDAEEAVLPSAEWEIGHRSGNANVDADVSGWSFIAELARR